jgi:hypothetical protein
MKAVFTYENGETKLEINGGKTPLNGLSDSFRNYIETIRGVYDNNMKIMNKIHPGVREPKSRLEIELSLELISDKKENQGA